MRRTICSVLVLFAFVCILISAPSEAPLCVAAPPSDVVFVPDAYQAWEPGVALEGVRPVGEAEDRRLQPLTPRAPVSPSAEEALGTVPEWLEMDLYDTFTRMPWADQEAYGQALLSISDPRLIDEVAFSIAHSSVRILMSGAPDLYVRNAELLYQIADEIPYAEIVDHGDPASDPNFYSTVRYRTVRGGEMGQYELPLDIYYWYVAHPKLPEENPSRSSDAGDGDFACGYLWREYLFYNPSEEYDYSTNFMTKAPNRITDADVSAWGPSASGYLVDGARECPDGIVACGPAWEKPTLIEYSLGYCRVVVTTMEVEKAANAGHGELLENLVMRSDHYGGGLLLPPLDPSGNYSHPDEVVIVDSRGDSSILDPILSVLDDHEIVHWVMTPQEMSEANWDAFTKIIIPSHQDLMFYLSIANSSFMDKFNEWTGRVAGALEFHGACDVENTWSDLNLFGLAYDSEPLDDLAVFGYPVLGDVIANASYLWDDAMVEANLPGNRPFEPDSMALDVITNWVSRIMAFKRRSSSWLTQSNQICFQHGGYCGEIGHMMNAAARTCLLPSATVCDYTLDHVSNEFWEQQWRGYEVGWEVGPAMIASQKMISNHASAVVQERADMFPVNATSRFTPVCRFHAAVLDSQGNPVDCAMVRVWVPLGAGADGLFGTPISDYTDSSGELIIELGYQRDYWFEVRSEAGDIGKERVLWDTQTDMDYYHTFTVGEGAVPQLSAIEPLESPSVPSPSFKLSASFSADYETLYSLSGLTFSEKKEAPANVDFFIVDGDNFGRYRNGEPFSAYEWRQDCKSDEVYFEMPSSPVYYLVFSNEDTLAAKEFLSINVEVSENEGEDWAVCDGYTDFVAIPAQTSFVLVFGSTLGPSVYAAGFFEAEVDSETGFELGVQAFVQDPDGLQDIREVELCYGGVGLGKYLHDDGLGSDLSAGDGIFTFTEQYLPGGIPSGVYGLEIAATDLAGNRSVPWPYLNVVASPLSLSSEPPRSSREAREPAAAAADAPVILGGGFFGGETVQCGDVARMVVYVDDPDGLSDIERVELFLEGGLATGIQLNDDGLDGDDQAGDGAFTFQTAVPAGLPSGIVTLEVIAFDNSGNASATYPRFVVR